jgi:hypothetical protein
MSKTFKLVLILISPFIFVCFASVWEKTFNSEDNLIIKRKIRLYFGIKPVFYFFLFVAVSLLLLPNIISINLNSKYFMYSISTGILISFIFYYINEYLPASFGKSEDADLFVDVVLKDFCLGFVPNILPITTKENDIKDFSEIKKYNTKEHWEKFLDSFYNNSPGTIYTREISRKSNIYQQNYHMFNEYLKFDKQLADILPLIKYNDELRNIILKIKHSKYCWWINYFCKGVQSKSDFTFNMDRPFFKKQENGENKYAFLNELIIFINYSILLYKIVDKYSKKITENQPP